MASIRVQGADEGFVGDLANAANVAAALDGISRVFYLAPVALPHEVDVGKSYVAASISAGVRRLVFSSVIHPVLGTLPNQGLKAPVEAAILESQLEYTFLHPTVLFQNYASAWNGIMDTGIIAERWSNETRFSRVDYRDVAEITASALTEDGLLYGTFELCAEGWLNRFEVAGLLSAVLKRTILPQQK
jgi:uncharacterized protein YbjT (DUF2867 family)